MTIRESIVAEAQSFIGTPYRVGALVKGGGVDCASFLYLVAKNCGLLTEEFELYYPADWWMHTSDERYLLRAMRHGQKMLESVGYPTFQALPGDVILGRVVGSKVYNHGGIVTKWPKIIHAISPEVCEADASSDLLWSHRDMVWFDIASPAEWTDCVR